MKMDFKVQPVGAVPCHLAIIMDGNGRWARQRGLPRAAGHQAGVEAVRRATEACCEIGIPILTLYTFSTENWGRPAEEVDFLMRLIEGYVSGELPALQRNGVHVQLMGRRAGLPGALLRAVDEANCQTRDNTRLVLNLAINYGGRGEIMDAMQALTREHRQAGLSPSEINEAVFARRLYCTEIPDVDLLVRSGGERRLSNFLLWRAVGAVFWTTPVLWPDFQRQHLLEALKFYRGQAAWAGE